MLLGALLDAGVQAELMQNAAAALGIGAELRISYVDRSGIRSTRVDVLEHGQLAEAGRPERPQTAHGPHAHSHGHAHEPDAASEPHPHDHSHLHSDDFGKASHTHEHDEQHSHDHAHSRRWPEIRGLIEAAAIPEGAKKIAQRAFALLAEAEAKIHGIATEQVHFHEVGAVDTITDIVCAAVGLDALGVEEWRCPAVNVGSGFVNCAHGRMPVPAPATAELLRGVPVYAAGPAMELTTPTGAAMLRALDCRFEAGGVLAAERIGYGAGSRNPNGFANVLRLTVGKAVAAAESGSRKSQEFLHDRVVVLECALDDATPQVLAHAIELALEYGALDAMAAAVTMKKGRLGMLLTVLAKPEDEEPLTRLIFRETTTLGIRRREEERAVLEREFVTVTTTFGRIRVKVARAAGEILNAMPEYEDCRRAAREHGVPLRAAMEAALAAWGEMRAAKA